MIIIATFAGSGKTRPLTNPSMEDKEAKDTAEELMKESILKPTMWERRIYLFLLKTYIDSRKNFCNGVEYATLKASGVSSTEFGRFAVMNFDLVSVFLLYAGLKKPPKTVTAEDFIKKCRSKELPYNAKVVDKNEAVFDVQVCCASDEYRFIEIKQDRIKILYPGKEFIKFGEFYSQLYGKYQGLIGAVVGVLGLLAIQNFSVLENWLADLWLKMWPF